MMSATSRSILVLCAAVICGAALASPATTGVPGTPANRIVGTWEAAAQTGPCGGPFGPPFLATTMFHAGGTLTETNAAPLSGVPTPWGQSVRGPAFGTWSYNPATGIHTAQMRFNWYVGGFYHGFQQINFESLELSPDGSVISGLFNASRNFADGSPPVPNCGVVSLMRFP